MRPVLALQWNILLTVLGGTSFVDILCFFLSCVCYTFVLVCLYVPHGRLPGGGCPRGSLCGVKL